MSSDAQNVSGGPSFLMKYKWPLLIVALLVVLGGIYVSRLGQVSTTRTEVVAKQVSIPSSGGGAVMEILVKEFDTVKKGQVVFRMNNVRQQRELEAAELAMEEAKGKVDAARVAVKSANDENREAKQQELTAAEQSFSEAESKLNQAQARLAACDIKSPIDGHVGKIFATTQIGLMSGEPMINLVDPTNTWVLAKFDNTQVKDVKPGQKATLITSKGRIEGVVDWVGRTEEEDNEEMTVDYGSEVQMVKEVEVKIIIPQKTRESSKTAIVPGMEITATIDTRS